VLYTTFLFSFCSCEHCAKWPWPSSCKTLWEFFFTVGRLEVRLTDPLDSVNGVPTDVPEVHQPVHEHLCKTIRAVSKSIDQLRITKLALYLDFATRFRQFIHSQHAMPASADSESSEPWKTHSAVSAYPNRSCARPDCWDPIRANGRKEWERQWVCWCFLTIWISCKICICLHSFHDRLQYSSGMSGKQLE
jgi:hypothetical protein